MSDSSGRGGVKSKPQIAGKAQPGDLVSAPGADGKGPALCKGLMPGPLPGFGGLLPGVLKSDFFFLQPGEVLINFLSESRSQSRRRKAAAGALARCLLPSVRAAGVLRGMEDREQPYKLGGHPVRFLYQSPGSRVLYVGTSPTCQPRCSMALASKLPARSSKKLCAPLPAMGGSPNAETSPVPQSSKISQQKVSFVGLEPTTPHGRRGAWGSILPPPLCSHRRVVPEGRFGTAGPPPHADVPKSTRSNPGVICTKLLLGVPLHMQLGLFLARTFHLRRVGPKLKFLGICCLWEGSVSLCMCRTEELGLGEHRWTPGLWKVPFKPALFKFLG